MVWGQDDCVYWAGDVAWCYLGRDPIAILRGKWDSQFSAFKFRLKLGRDFSSAYRKMAPLLGLRRIPPEDAVPGNVGLVLDANNNLIAAAKIEQGWVARAQVGFGVLEEAKIAWRLK